MFESWSGYQNKTGAKSPIFVLDVRPTDENIVRQNRIAILDAEGAPQG